ncbi:MAG TPA: hypothetical protein VGL08_06740 [Paraburkholderia sp.]|jgi:hypothetical protein
MKTTKNSTADAAPDTPALAVLHPELLAAIASLNELVARGTRLDARIDAYATEKGLLQAERDQKAQALAAMQADVVDSAPGSNDEVALLQQIDKAGAALAATEQELVRMAALPAAYQKKSEELDEARRDAATTLVIEANFWLKDAKAQIGRELRAGIQSTQVALGRLAALVPLRSEEVSDMLAAAFIADIDGDSHFMRIQRADGGTDCIGKNLVDPNELPTDPALAALVGEVATALAAGTRPRSPIGLRLKEKVPYQVAPSLTASEAVIASVLSNARRESGDIVSRPGPLGHWRKG